MKQTYFLPAILLLAATAGRAQSVGIGTSSPDASAVLDLSATGKGLLIPRMDSATRAGIASPPDGLMVFQNDGRRGFWYAVGGTWLYIPDKTRSGDNLGNHTATQNLNLADKLLVGGTAATPGTTGLRITAAGYVGLNITNPYSRLASTSANIVGADGQGGNVGTLTWATNQAGYVGSFYNGSTAGTGNALAVKVASTSNGTGALDVSQQTSQTTTGTSLLRVTGAGRLGLGTNTPAGRFHLVTSAASFDDDYLFDQYATTGDQAIYFRRAGGTPTAPADLVGGEQLGGIGFGARVNGSQAYINSYLRSFFRGLNNTGTLTLTDLRLGTSGTERMRIDTSGYVGIGTTGPLFRLHVTNGSVFTGTDNNGFIVDVGGNARVGLLKYGGHEGGIWRLNNQDFEIGRVSNSTTPLTTLPGTPDTWTTDLYVGSTGYLGLGTTTPSGRFHLVTNGSGAGDDYLFDQYAASGDQAIYFRRAGGTATAPTDLASGEQLGAVAFGARFNGSQGYSNSYLRSFYRGLNTAGTVGLTDLRLGTSGIERMRIDTSGYVGVGTSSPHSTLHVAGTLAVRVVNGLVGSTAGTLLGATAAGFLGLSPASGADYYLLPSASAVPGRLYHLRNNSTARSAYLGVVAGGGTIYDGGSTGGVATYELQTTGSSKSVTAVSDGNNWIIYRAGN